MPLAPTVVGPRSCARERAVRNLSQHRAGHVPGSVWYEAVMWVLMSAAEREEFLAGVHIGVLSAAAGTAGPALARPVWYSQQPGGPLTRLTRPPARKAAAGPGRRPVRPCGPGGR